MDRVGTIVRQNALILRHGYCLNIAPILERWKQNGSTQRPTAQETSVMAGKLFWSMNGLRAMSILCALFGWGDETRSLAEIRLQMVLGNYIVALGPQVYHIFRFVWVILILSVLSASLILRRDLISDPCRGRCTSLAALRHLIDRGGKLGAQYVNRFQAASKLAYIGSHCLVICAIVFIVLCYLILAPSFLDYLVYGLVPTMNMASLVGQNAINGIAPAYFIHAYVQLKLYQKTMIKQVLCSYLKNHHRGIIMVASW